MLGSNQRPKDYESPERSKEINDLGPILFRKFGKVPVRRARTGAGLRIFAEQFSGSSWHAATRVTGRVIDQILPFDHRAVQRHVIRCHVGPIVGRANLFGADQQLIL